jgi:CheY-specific phosphatase CheX
MTGHLELATVELFEACGIGLRPSSAVLDPAAMSDASSVAAVIGYAGEKLRGSLVLLASVESIGKWMRAIDETENDPREVLSEFSNMLLGHLKMRLLRDGITIYLSTPTTAQGTGLTIGRPPVPSTWLAFEGPGTGLHVRIDASFDEGFQAKECKELQGAPKAGNLVLF